VIKLAVPALLALSALHVAATGAMAAKETFQRTKPHVNVGSGQTGTATNQLATGQDGSQATIQLPADCDEKPNKADGTPRPECAPQGQ
jgi:hypothetical protein